MGLGQNKSSRPAGLFSHLLRHGKSFIALLCASFHSSNTPHRKSPWGMTENPARYGTIYSGRVPNPHAIFTRSILNTESSCPICLAPFPSLRNQSPPGNGTRAKNRRRFHQIHEPSEKKGEIHRYLNRGWPSSSDPPWS